MWDWPAFSVLRCILFSFLYIFICIGYVIIWTLLFLQLYFCFPNYPYGTKEEKERERERRSR